MDKRQDKVTLYAQNEAKEGINRENAYSHWWPGKNVAKYHKETSLNIHQVAKARRPRLSGAEKTQMEYIYDQQEGPGTA